MLKALSSTNMNTSSDLSKFVASVVCSEESEACMLTGECLECGKGALFERLFAVYDDAMESEPVVWYKWITSENKALKISQEGTLEQLLSEMKEELPRFLAHCFVKHKQSTVFEKTKEECKNKETMAVIQVDFSENYSTKYQDEIQSTHWNQAGITVFTAVTWVGTTHQSYALISDYLSHDKFAVARFLNVLFKVHTKRITSI